MHLELFNRFFLFGCSFLIISTDESKFSDTSQKKEYKYAFDVWPVGSCPMNGKDLRAAAARIGCNETRGYHCVPDKFHESLIEFCYNKTRILVAKGNCLELAANGILNHVKCQNFTWGCPSKPYFSNEIYKYPVCLNIEFGCFTSDVNCCHKNFKESRTWELGEDTTECDPLKTVFPNDLNVLSEVESELTVASTYLSQLLRRHCRNGTFKNFEYLLKKRILKKKDDENCQRILTAHDKDGYALLHCAAVGGSTVIFKALMNATNQINVDDTTYDGQTVLHLACKHNHVSLCRFLLFENSYKTLLINKNSNPGWNAAHFTAAGGSIQILNLLVDQGLDITCVTNNGLNVLDIACLHNNKELCNVLIDREDFKSSLVKSDPHGWTIAHFAAMVGNKDVFDRLVEKKIKMVKTTQQKTILHVCCEYGHYGICKKVLENYDGIVYDKDDEHWNALHYAAKGGNLQVYKEVEKYFKKYTRLCDLTRDERTVLHIACINNSTKICQYICNEKLYKGIINSKGEFKKWTAAHYVAVEIKEDGAEEELIRILQQSGIDLQAVTTDGLTVLGVACEHRNRNLINYLLGNHSELLGVGIPYLKNAAKDSNDEKIESQIAEALENYNGKRVDIIVEKKTM